MHKKKIGIVLLSIVMHIYGADITVRSQETALIQLFLGVVCSDGEKKPDQNLVQIAQTMQKDFMFSGQCQVVVQACAPISAEKSSRMFKKLYKRGYVLALFVKRISSDAVQWCLCDTASARVLQAQQFRLRSSGARVQGHALADEMWPLLMDCEGCFSTRIAYCKECVTKKGVEKHIYVADYDGSHEQCLVAAPTISIAPRWNKDPRRPLLFYSSYTPVNMRLMVTDMAGRSLVAADVPGITMQPDFSHDGKEVVYCASGGKGNCQLWHCCDAGVVQLTSNTGNNIAPIFGGEAVVYFCSDVFTGNPLICSYDMHAKTTQLITQTGYAASPDYNSRTNQLVYTKMVAGVMQLFTYDIQRGVDRQITFQGGNKHECSWSPCGTYIIYAAEWYGKSRIFVYNTMVGSSRPITSAGSVCSYPAWSGKYAYSSRDKG
ncbi:MAG TPA: hypothetical protein VEK38_00965 [Candidatus Bathyarchaeia archaeon]|nr:hypothetical protein [Candidatus Bathyarchaeia archaeon]